ncbi:uncharacterized protein LOC142329540 [Lycorma delicatula]|uniref:uncharacterized protein LOC142329540 n=1 Tax=Lycorma delicatula TaxID=130591 RepID=UPI003F519124
MRFNVNMEHITIFKKYQPQYGSTANGAADVENPKKLKYPKSVFFIISNEFCERFSYYGMRTILSLYLQNKLRYSETDSTLIYHIFVTLCYFFPLFGAILADSFLGKYKTILYLSIVYALGSITISAASTGFGFLGSSEHVFSLLGLLLIAMGTGGIKPCVSSFGGDQFVLPEQEYQLQQFFSVFYFSINAGSLISTFLTPELREDVKCLGQDTCYPLAFGIPAILMVVSLLIFVAGRFMYKVKKPTGNIIVDVTKCSVHAVIRKIKSSEKHEHWLDYASDKYSKELIEDTKIVMSLILLFSPTVFFWSLFEQQGTSWTFQATRMNGKIGSYVIKPDQMQVINPILILIFIPIFNYVIYPILARLYIVRTSLQKLVAGGLLVAISFVLAAAVESKIEPTYEILPKAGEAQLRIINGFNCSGNVSFIIDNENYQRNIDRLGILQFTSLKISDSKTVDVTVTIQRSTCPSLTSDLQYKGLLNLYKEESVSYLFSNSKETPTNFSFIRLGEFDVIKKTDDGSPQLRIVYDISKNSTLNLLPSDGSQTLNFNLLTSDHVTKTTAIPSNSYKLQLNGKEIASSVFIEFGGVYTLLIKEEENQSEYNLFAISPPSSVHILWQLPQIMVLTAAEIMFSITGLEFSYSQAPKSMKSVMSSVWLLTDSIGNLIVVFMTEVFHSDSRVKQFLIFAGIMVLIMIVFALLAMRYKYVTPRDDEEEKEERERNINEAACKENPAFNPEELNAKSNNSIDIVNYFRGNSCKGKMRANRDLKFNFEEYSSPVGSVLQWSYFAVLQCPYPPTQIYVETLIKMMSDEYNNKTETELDAIKINGRQIEKNEAAKEKEIKYPKAVFFIILNELCERFSYYGMRTILAIYLRKKLKYSENTATIIFHLFVMLCYFFPLVGAVIADSYLGKFRTIIYLSIVYAIGNSVLALSSMSVLQIPHRELTIIGLLLIATGTGGIKPCVSSFGGDQFIVPQQEMQLQQFFSIFYFSINIGSMLGTLISPILRQDVHCLGENTCFPIAFALPAFLMISALVIFIAGKSLYKIKKPEGNVMVDFSKCVSHALKRKFCCKTNNTKYNHWMDYAEDKYDKKLIEDIKIVLSIAVVLLPTVCFWALFEQQGSSWTFQASRMNGALWDGYDVKPDQIHIINPILILLLIPLFQKYVYPLFTKLRILRTPLQKMSFGGVIAAFAFFISGILELQLQSTYAVLPKPGEAQLRLYNGYNCSIYLDAQDGIKNIIGPTDILELKSLNVVGKRDIQATLKIDKRNCSHLPSDLMWTGSFSITENEAISYLIYDSNKNLTTRSTGFEDIEKSDYGKPKLRVLYSLPESQQLSLINSHNKEGNLYILLNASDITIPDAILPPGTYSVKVNETEIDNNVKLEFGAVYRLMIVKEDENINYKLFTITPPNSIHMFWILPQFVVITLAEIFFSITGLEFTFMQAPNSMKSVTSSLWLLSTSLGNLVVVFIAELLHSDNHAMQFFSYGGLMLVVMGVFILLAMRYKYVQIVTETNENKTHNDGTTNEGFTHDNDPIT